MNDAGAGISAVIVSYNTRVETLRCLAALRAATSRPLETILVDNASTDGTTTAVRAGFPDALIVDAGGNLGFSRANNLGLRRARHPYALIINSDAEVRPGAVDALAQLLDERPAVAIAAPYTLNSDGTPQLSFGPPLTVLQEWRQRRFGRALSLRRQGALRRLREMCRTEHQPAWVSGSCFLARSRALHEAGLFDEGFFLYEEDVDLCLRVRRAGWQVVFTPAAEVIHHAGRSMAHAPPVIRLEYHRSHLRYYQKHNGAVSFAALRLWLALRATLGWSAAVLQKRDPSVEKGLLRLACKPDPL